MDSVIPTSLYYILWLLVFIWFPAALFWAFNLGNIRAHAKIVLVHSVLVAAGCLLIEYFVVQEVLILHRVHFLGIYIWGIPFEDYLFFLTFSWLVAPVALWLRSSLDKNS
ncbi:MAG: hypothetical protein K0S20_398 [Patescibacteria group bacterium]|jgi:lycopene cyclase domain-containing protein|nr:hypothetical protein [Patescibacteria group bacterium]